MKIIVKNLQNRIPVDSRKIVKTVQKVLSQEGIKKSGEITLCFVNDARTKELNLRYLKRNKPTDVIAFDISEPQDKKNIFADIAVSSERAIDNARAFKTSPDFELYLYVIHGVLHILGYDDKSKKDKLAMRKREKEIMKALNMSP